MWPPEIVVARVFGRHNDAFSMRRGRLAPLFLDCLFRPPAAQRTAGYQLHQVRVATSSIRSGGHAYLMQLITGRPLRSGLPEETVEE